jgi:hypothetical protein
MSERDLEAPEADAAEQRVAVVDDESDADDSDAGDGAESEVPYEVDPADRAEQQRSVGLGDDEYR